MKAEINKTPAQNQVVQKVQQEPTTGGIATLSDNRSRSVIQRKQQQLMNKHDNPIQQKPKGSARFQQIATAMGAKYGVNTSDLSATHNSPFPGKLNAEATIQGNKIHFAPGMDTDYNMRHEVAHAIDNTLNGTPKGDQLVNGLSVDTTREKVVDIMAKKPVGHINSIPLVQKKNEKNEAVKSPVTQLMTGFEIEFSANVFNDHSRYPSIRITPPKPEKKGLFRLRRSAPGKQARITPQELRQVTNFLFATPFYGTRVAHNINKPANDDWDIVVEDYNVQLRSHYLTIVDLLHSNEYINEQPPESYTPKQLEYRTRPFDTNNEEDIGEAKSVFNTIIHHANQTAKLSKQGNISSIPAANNFFTGAPIELLRKLGTGIEGFDTAVDELAATLKANESYKVHVQNNTGFLPSEIPALVMNSSAEYKDNAGIFKDVLSSIVEVVGEFSNSFIKATKLEDIKQVEADAITGWLMLVMQYMFAQHLIEHDLKYEQILDKSNKNMIAFLSKVQSSLSDTTNALPKRIREKLANDPDMRNRWIEQLKLCNKAINEEEVLLDKFKLSKERTRKTSIPKVIRDTSVEVWINNLIANGGRSSEVGTNRHSKIALEDLEVKSNDEDEKLIVLEDRGTTYRFADEKTYGLAPLESLGMILQSELDRIVRLTSYRTSTGEIK